MLSIEAFAESLARQFNLAETPSPDAEFFGALDFDSMAGVMLVVWVEAIAEPMGLPADVPPIFTVGEAYRYYVALRETAL